MIKKLVPLAGLLIVASSASADDTVDNPYSFQLPSVTSRDTNPVPTPPIGTTLFDISSDTVFVWNDAGVWTPAVGEASSSSSGIVSTGAQTFAGDKTFNGVVRVSTTTDSPSGDVDALSSSKSFIEVTNSTAWYLNGIAAGSSGQVITVYNGNTNDMTVSNLSSFATAGDKIITNTGSDFGTTDDASATFVYDTAADSGNGAWRMVSALE